MIKGNKDREDEEGGREGRGGVGEVSPGCATPQWGLIEGLTVEVEVGAAIQAMGGPPTTP